MHSTIDRVDKIVNLDKDYNLVCAKTGNMSYVALLVVQKAGENNILNSISN